MQRVRTLVLAAAFATLPLACGGAPVPPPPRPVAIADPEQLVTAFYHRLNAEDLEGILALMVREPELVEPFSRPDSPTVHRGYRAVGEFFSQAFRTRDDQVVPEYIRAEAGGVSVGWSMQGSDGTGMSGTTHIDVRNGQIARVVIEQRE